MADYKVSGKSKATGRTVKTTVSKPDSLSTAEAIAQIKAAYEGKYNNVTVTKK